MTKIIYILILTASSTLIAYLYVLANDGFGRGDVAPFAVYTVILSALSLLLIRLYNKLFERVHFVVGFILCVVFSTIQTRVFILLLWLVFGPWKGAISFPFQLIWITGIGLANLYLLTTSESKFNFRHLITVTGIIGLSILTFKLVNKGKDALAEHQNYDIICLIHRPNDTELTKTEDLLKFGLTNEEANTVLEQGLTGTFWADKFFRVSESKMISTDYPNYDFDEMEETPGADIEFMFGNELDSTINLNSNKLIIIMNHPLKESFELDEPLNSSMILIQDLTGDNFTEIHLGEDKNSKKITINGTDFRSFPYSTPILLDLKGRTEFRLHGFQWMNK
ncbi:MAG: hypothetical protein RIA69_16600 [Cyclobacteriaceae bacterium]